jgi:hypothetical protein
MLVKCWNKAVTRDLNIKIAVGEIKSNTNNTAYIMDVVSGEHFLKYKAPPHQVAKLQLSASVACSGISGLNGNCKDSKQEQQKQEKKVRLLD